MGTVVEASACLRDMMPKYHSRRVGSDCVTPAGYGKSVAQEKGEP